MNHQETEEESSYYDTEEDSSEAGTQPRETIKMNYQDNMQEKQQTQMASDVAEDPIN